MKNLKGALVFGQSGGPTSVINASAAGVFLEALDQELITEVYGAANGIKGILDENLIDMRQEDRNELELLKNTPSSALGSVRYKLKNYEDDPTDYNRILEVFKKYNIRYFFYNGGNDSMDTCNKISKFLQQSGWDCNVMGVPKTIDNDLFGTDHCPGYGSAAKYVATSIMELYLDSHVYDKGMVMIVEVMGRNAGWLTAAASLASIKGLGPDLIYLPEQVFDVKKFVADVKEIAAKQNNNVIAVVSEGIKDKDGNLIGAATKTKDSFGHAQLGGVANTLAGIIADELGVKVRPIEFSLLQRCAAHIGSRTDIDEAVNAGKMAVQYAVAGETDKMVIFERDTTSKEYKINYKLVNLTLAANTEKTVPAEWIKANNRGLTEDFYNYALPLIQGNANGALEDSLPRFAKLKKVFVKK